MTGAVQGVGFRPFVFREATRRGLLGWVRNGPDGVHVEVQGPRPALLGFEAALREGPPAPARVDGFSRVEVPAVAEARFEIHPSAQGGAPTVLVLPDLATCDDCRRELFDPSDRRHRHPFINCTRCGPRFSIVRGLPYDRPRPTMAGFAMCARCAAEYEDPRDRRFHAQPVACHDCGPTLRLVGPAGDPLATRAAALEGAVRRLEQGEIVALKGLGGMQLLVDATNGAAVLELRRRKGRPHKPLALMVQDCAAARRIAVVSSAEQEALTSAAAPILLLRPVLDAPFARDAVCPDVPVVGVMLPTTPLHHLLARDLARPLVATSGNLSDEPICIDDREAVRRLGPIADALLLHDRPIERHVDDSVAAVTRGVPRVLRRARGFAPSPIPAPPGLPTVLALGAYQKVAPALLRGDLMFPGRHVGDLSTPEARQVSERSALDLLRLYEARPVAVAHDLHPDFPSTRYAEQLTAPDGPVELLRGLPRVAVQHHHAHLASCMADNGVTAETLGVCFDGTGLGTDGTPWGGEFLLGDLRSVRRVARLRPLRLPGGDSAARSPARVALALLYQVLGEAAWDRTDLPCVAALTPSERHLLPSMLRTGLRSPWTSSVGRLFDGVAALLGLHHPISWEGQAASALQARVDREEPGAWPLPLVPGAGDGLDELDWRPLIAALLADLAAGVELPVTAARFHGALCSGIVRVARSVEAQRVALTGGCFVNRVLLEGAADALDEAGFEVLLHRQVPCGDGGIAVGQALVAAARMAAQ